MLFRSGLLGFVIIGALSPVLADIIHQIANGGVNPVEIQRELSLAADSLRSFTYGALALLALTAVIALLRKRLLTGRTVRKAGVWDCGYIKPTSRMQYTASSFAQPIVDFFNVFHHGRKRFKPPQGYFPATSYFETETLDTSQEAVYRPIFETVGRILSKLKILQHGRIQLYVLYVVLTLIVLLFWKLR